MTVSKGRTYSVTPRIWSSYCPQVGREEKHIIWTLILKVEAVSIFCCIFSSGLYKGCFDRLGSYGRFGAWREIFWADKVWI